MVLSKVPGVIYVCFQDETWCIFGGGGINAQVLDALPVTSNSVQTRNKNPSTEIPTTYNHTLASPFNGPLPDTRRKGTASLWWLYNTSAGTYSTCVDIVVWVSLPCDISSPSMQCQIEVAFPSLSILPLTFPTAPENYLPFNRSLNAHHQSVTYHSAINGYQNKTQSSFNMAECYRVVTGFTPWGNKGVAWRKR